MRRYIDILNEALMGTDDSVLNRTIVAFVDDEYENLEVIDRLPGEALTAFCNRSRERMHEWMDTGRYEAITIVDGLGLDAEGNLLAPEVSRNQKPSTLN